MKKLARSVAKHRMKEAGYTQFCKKGSDGKSQFSKLWREFAGMPVAVNTKKKNNNKKSFLAKLFENKAKQD